MSQVLRLAMKTIGLRRVLRGSSAQIAALGQQRLQALLALAKNRSPYYADRLRHVDPSRVVLSELPTLTKSEMMKNFDDLVTERDLKRSELDAFVSDPGRLGEWYKGKYALSRTSGTQGEKALIVQDRSMLELLFALQVARGSAFPATVASAITRLISPGRFAVITIGRGFFPTATGIAYCPEASQRFVNRLWIQKTEPVEQVVSELNAFRPQVILSYASVLEMLAREVLAGRLRVTKKSGLRQVLNMSEPISQGAKKFVGEAFGIAVTDSYAMGECMALSTACPQGHGMHVQADWAMLEVVDQDNQPVPNGMPGRKVLVTNLYNTIQPFIRYVVEDVVTMSPMPCPCGSPLPVILRVEGRRDEMVWIRDGDRFREVHPYVFVDVLDECPEAGAYQIVQTERNRFKLRIAPAQGRELGRDDLARLMREGLERFNLAGLIQFDFELSQRIASDVPGGKLKRITSLVGPPERSAEGARVQPRSVA
ncbi:MAG TPA: AMP-binding protein [Gemmataceae bacterium]|jgi:phenylacetate-coenzyme A ligase PaaK-like adenylate-forming protein|nr:AMP-binding protein [Gemmataceae bacterium]